MSVASRRERERAERRAGIMEAAARLFRRQGIAATTMDEIAAEAELSKGTLYLYFANKDELFLAVASQKIRLVLTRFDELGAAAGDCSGLELTGELLRGYAEVALEDPAMFRAALTWVFSPEPVDIDTDAFREQQELIQRIIEAIVGAIERGQQDGTVRNDVEPPRLAHRLWSGLIGALLIRSNAEELGRRFPQPIGFDELVPGLIDLLCRGLRPEKGEG